MPPRTDNGSVESLLPHLAPDAMLLVDQSGRISQANALAEQLFGYPPGALTGQLLAMLIPQRLRDSHQQHVIEYLRDPLPRPMGVGKNFIGSAARRQRVRRGNQPQSPGDSDGSPHSGRHSRRDRASARAAGTGAGHC
ncbi:MAG: PAS domain-containing protein [Candidatus Competibacteraceae bacterium]|nr:MAG: PAS domain-containing protein [Candidatus Competibacteraceae bacterium]